MTKQIDRKAVKNWDQYRENVIRSTDVPVESTAEQARRIQKLSDDFAAFCRWYFPNYTSAGFAAFQLRFARRVIEADELYIVRAWAREHAKSVIAGLFLPIYLKCTGRMKNMLLVSHSYDNACELLMPLMLNLESNQRLISDYGDQKGWRGWEQGRFISQDGCSFRAIGAGQSPRGSRNEEKRPDFVLVDDIDTDEEGRNQGRIEKKWAWIEKALFPTMSISGTKRFVIVGNIISRESIVVKASRVADDFEQINILDSKGRPSWKERYTLAQVNYMLSKISYAAGQSEYFNNPISEGMVFRELTWGKVPPLSKFRFVVAYTDPSWKNTRANDFKATVLIGELNGTFYIIKAYLEQTTTARMIEWHYDIYRECEGKAAVYFYMEANFLQDIFLEEFQKAGKAAGTYLPISGDHRAKPDKFARIEANLEPLNRQGRLVLNEAERDNPHMRRLEEQFKAIEPALPAHDDGPDAVEGAVWIINNKLRMMTPIKVGRNLRGKYKY